MLVVSESEAREAIDEQGAYEAVEEVFKSMNAGTARNFPVLRDELGYAGAIFGVKSAFDASGKTLGLKFGGYWPNNIEKGIINRPSCYLIRPRAWHKQ